MRPAAAGARGRAAAGPASETGGFVLRRRGPRGSSGRFPVAAPGGVAAGASRFCGVQRGRSWRRGLRDAVQEVELSCGFAFPNKLSFLRGMKRVSC